MKWYPATTEEEVYERIANLPLWVELVDVYCPDGVREAASEYLYMLMEEREPETNISHSKMPSFSAHQAFVSSRPYRFWYLIKSGEGHFVGHVSATHTNEIGVVILKAHRRKGYAMAALKKLMDMHKPIEAQPSVCKGHWIANVNPVNAPSRALFEELGGRLIQVTYELP